MPADWRSIAFEELLALPVRNGIYKKKEFHGHGVKMVNMGEIFAYPRLTSVDMKRVALSEGEVQRFEVRAGDLLFARRSLVAEGAGKCCVVIEANEPTAFESSIIRARPDPDKLDPLYAYYYFNSPTGLQSLSTIRRQVAVAGITGGDLAKLPVPTPPIPEQRAIAHVLGTLDDKIELNRRMNETLEGMARALFKSWFVDFDPVRAKMDGRPTGLPPALDALFPDALVESALGEIPVGWEVGTLGSISRKPQYGYTASAQEEPIGPKFLRIADINKSAWVSWETVPHCEIDEGDYEKYRVRQGDILIARMADPGHGVVVEQSPKAVFASYLIRFRLVDGRYERYLQYWMRSPKYWELVTSRAAGTTRRSLNAKVLASFPLPLPSVAVVSAFSAIVDDLRERVVNNVVESQVLANLRDTLLPKLMSGEVSLLPSTLEHGKLT